MITIGVAGHIDHGKSSIVKRLTGTDPDRLPEEKLRGMTIDLGFAHWMGPAHGMGPARSSDQQGEPLVAFVDVPGHERFVRNMIAGAGGIEGVILVVAADDGWMPQSQEHFDIVRLLGVTKGFIVVSKTDLVEPDWIETVIDDIKTQVSGSFLDGAPVIPVSSTSGDGFDNLENELLRLANENLSQAEIGKPRLFIDRSFDISGLGKVVTGTLRGGSLEVGQKILIHPSGAEGKVRALQRHGAKVDSVSPGGRTAVAFTGVARDELRRDCAVTTPQLADNPEQSRHVIARVSILPDCPVTIKTRRKALMFLGASEIACEILLEKGGAIAPGESGVVVLRCGEPPLCFLADRFVLRLPTPQVTIGGGVVLGWSESRPQKRFLNLSQELSEDEKDFPLDKLITFTLSQKLITEKSHALLRSQYSFEEISAQLRYFLEQEILGDSEGMIYLISELEKFSKRLTDRLSGVFKSQPHLVGLTTGEIRKLAHKEIELSEFASEKELEMILNILVEKGKLARATGKYQLPGRELGVSGAVKTEAERILKEISAGGFSPPLTAALVKKGKTSRDALGYLLNTNKIVRVSSEVVLERAVWDKVLATIVRTLESGEELSVAVLRTKLGTSRKYALPILEETDRMRITSRVDDKRVKGAEFDSAQSKE